MKRNLIQNSKKTESLAQLKFSLDNRREKKEAQFQVQLKEALEEIENYQKLEELAQNFDFLTLENFLSSNEQTHKITLATYKTFNFRQKVLFGFETKAFIYADLLNFILMFFISFGEIYSLISFITIFCFVPIGLIFSILSVLFSNFSEYLNIIENSKIFKIFLMNIPFFLMSLFIRSGGDITNWNFFDISRFKAFTKFLDGKNDNDDVLPLEIELYDSKKIKLPELRLLFKELQAMKLQPKLQITIWEDYTVDLININIADLDSGKISASILSDLERAKKPIKIKIEIEIDKSKFIN